MLSCRMGHKSYVMSHEYWYDCGVCVLWTVNSLLIAFSISETQHFETIGRMRIKNKPLVGRNKVYCGAPRTVGPCHHV